jgi:hypothetical protein
MKNILFILTRVHDNPANPNGEFQLWKRKAFKETTDNENVIKFSLDDSSQIYVFQGCRLKNEDILILIKKLGDNGNLGISYHTIDDTASASLLQDLSTIDFLFETSHSSTNDAERPYYDSIEKSNSSEGLQNEFKKYWGFFTKLETDLNSLHDLYLDSNASDEDIIKLRNQLLGE